MSTPQMASVYEVLIFLVENPTSIATDEELEAELNESEANVVEDDVDMIPSSFPGEHSEEVQVPSSPPVMEGKLRILFFV